ncbi:FHA domain containing protein [Babesia bovis T2Bo]|uniref:FHA domain containing protein n=1 Tax=Babesia bovis TaxID=5865 RepID=A7ANB3_BABBO|nr:FHA domain containing protein [Babesia bovis T2Bo]EDO08047.1 FHA domain containing protein [Babesia bovis T2Bo]|eukprot:XP_001611615.1 FHA domain containing protein [Babesia bovis T2Bo]
MQDSSILGFTLPRNVVNGNTEYTPPPWANFNTAEVLTQDNIYSLEIISRGKIIATEHLKDKRYYVLGSLDTCDLVYTNPLVSRRHLVLQYNRHGHLLLYDLKSTHGTTLNHEKIEPDKYYKLKNGDQVRIGTKGTTSRTYIVCGPDDPECTQQNEPELKKRKSVKDKLVKDEQELMDKVSKATAAEYYDTNLYFDEYDEYFDRDPVNNKRQKKEKQKVHTAASLQHDIQELYQAEIDTLNRWYDILKQSKEEGFEYTGDTPTKTDTLMHTLQLKSLESDRIKYQKQLDTIQQDIEHLQKLLKLTQT